MKKIVPLMFVALFLSTRVLAQTTKFPPADFVLHDPTFKLEKARTVLGSDGKGGNTFAFYAGTDTVQVISLSFSEDAGLLAVGSLPDRVDIWDLRKRKIVRSFKGGSQVALSSDGTKLAKDGDGIEIINVPSGKTLLKLLWTGGFVKRLSFDPEGRLLLVSANGDDDKVFDVVDARQLAELKNTQEGRFSKDGSLVVGGNAKHLITWSTHDWSKQADLPNGPEWVATIAADTDKDLVFIGGPKTAHLLRLSTGKEIAKVGQGYTNFAAFNRLGTLFFDYTEAGFGVWGTDGTKYCLEPNLGSNVAALSPNDELLAMSTGQKGPDVMIWNLKTIVAACGAIPPSGAN